MIMTDFLQKLLRGVAAFGHTKDGWNRLGFSHADCEARIWFAEMMREAGLLVRVDAFGNMFGRLEGLDPSLPAIATGSHLDTVPNGGNYDGVLGCAAGLAAIHELDREGGLRHPLELVIFQIEESARFACSTMGSKILCGLARMDDLETLVDRQGISLAQAMADAGLDFNPARISECALPSDAYKAFIELHMDQGPFLENAGIPLGVVTSIVGVRRARIYFMGKALHAGATPMQGRKNALLPAARAVLELDRIARGYAGKAGMVATAGNILVEPGAINVIPETAMIHCEMRAGEPGMLKEAWTNFENFVMRMATEYEVKGEIALTESSEPIPMNENIQELLRATCGENDVSWAEMVSGAGHDCMNMAYRIPSGMLFVRSVGGISHHPSECVRDDDAYLACKILKDALRALDK